MSRLRDRLVEGWDRVLPATAVLGTILMLLQWRRQRRRLERDRRLDEVGWERPGV
jgi:hypothetical protein